MKSFLIAISVFVAGLAVAQPEIMPPIVCSGVTTSAVAVTSSSEYTLSAYLKGLQIAVSGNGTCTVSVSTSGQLASRVVRSGTFVGTTMLRPCAQSTTNGVVVASFSPEFLASDKISISASSATVSNDNLTVTVIPVIDRLP